MLFYIEKEGEVMQSAGMYITDNSDGSAALKELLKEACKESLLDKGLNPEEYEFRFFLECRAERKRMSEREVKELMGTNRPTYQRKRGRIRSS